MVDDSAGNSAGQRAAVTVAQTVASSADKKVVHLVATLAAH